jgi:nodulation protein A
VGEPHRGHLRRFLTRQDGDVSELRWQTLHEAELTLPDHEAVAAMLAQAFPDWSHWYVGGRSWAGMEPERRVIATDDDDVVLAHAGVRRMFVVANGVETLVACVGLVAVSPRLQGSGHGRELMAQVDALLQELRVPFGVLQTGEDRVAFYGRCGWELLEGSVFTVTGSPEDGAGFVNTDDSNWLIRPTAARSEDWPGGTVWFDGQLV